MTASFNMNLYLNSCNGWLGCDWRVSHSSWAIHPSWFVSLSRARSTSRFSGGTLCSGSMRRWVSQAFQLLRLPKYCQPCVWPTTSLSKLPVCSYGNIPLSRKSGCWGFCTPCFAKMAEAFSISSPQASRGSVVRHLCSKPARLCLQSAELQAGSVPKMPSGGLLAHGLPCQQNTKSTGGAPSAPASHHLTTLPQASTSLGRPFPE